MSDADARTTVPWSAVNARRLIRHRLAEPGEPSAAACAEVTRALCGVHAQVLSAAEVSLATRIAGATRRDVREALWSGRSLVKTYGPRGTVHLLPAADLPMWCGALGALAEERRPSGERLMSAEETAEVAAGLAEILADAELTVDELTEALAETVGPWTADPVMDAFQEKWPRWRWAQQALAYRGALCFGPNKGRRGTYTSPRRWLPGFTPMAADAAVGELVRHYLYGYGPATVAEFARWLAAPKGWAERAFAALGTEIEPVTLAEAPQPVPAWQLAGDRLPDERPRGLRLLPYFDAFGVGSHPRGLLFAGGAAERALAGGQAGNFPLLLIDGQVAGVWHQRRSGRRLQLTVEPLHPLGPSHRAELAEQAARLAEIQETAEPSLTIGTITVGPHA